MKDKIQGEIAPTHTYFTLLTAVNCTQLLSETRQQEMASFHVVRPLSREWLSHLQNKKYFTTSQFTTSFTTRNIYRMTCEQRVIFGQGITRAFCLLSDVQQFTALPEQAVRANFRSKDKDKELFTTAYCLHQGKETVTDGPGHRLLLL